jgi:hypothetical protein
MTLIRGGPAGPDGLGGAYPNTVEADRAALWSALGGRQGVIRGFVASGVAGQMSLSFTAGAALVAERDAAGTPDTTFRGYHVWSDTATVVQFGPASPSARNDAVVAAFVDTEDGPVGTGGLAAGPYLVVVPGVSGTSTPRTDAQITAWLGRGGWIRLLDVPIASTDTQINVATMVDQRRTAGTSQFVLKGSDESVTSSTTLQNDDHLSLAVGVGTYEFSAVLYVDCASPAANGDIIVAFAFPTGTCHFSGLGPNNADLTAGTQSNGEWIVRLSATSGSTNIPFGVSPGATPLAIKVEGVLVASAAGTLQLMWAQGASSGNATRVRAGSHLRVDQVA